MSQDESEGVRNLREQLDTMKAELEAERQAKAELENQRAADLAAQRAQTLTSLFESVNLPKEAAGLYPSDADVTADAVSNWAQSHGIVAKPRTIEEPDAQDRLNQLMSSGGNPTEQFSDLANKMIAGVEQARARKTMPTAAELEDAETLNARVNQANRILEKEVLADRAKPFGSDGIAAYGGLVQPPSWANITEKALAER